MGTIISTQYHQVEEVPPNLRELDWVLKENRVLATSILDTWIMMSKTRNALVVLISLHSRPPVTSPAAKN